MLVPLSGPWARKGELHVKGAELAVDDINAAGGIKALGGAKLKLVVADAGDSTEKAKNAAQRIVAHEPDLVGGTGAFVSSFTLAVTEVTERAELPLLTLSYSDQITARGFKYVFQTSPTASKQAEDALPAVLRARRRRPARRAPKTVGIIMDNTASPVSFTKPMREGGFDKLGPQARRRRDLHAAAGRCDVAGAEGAQRAARPAAPADHQRAGRQADAREAERDGARQGPAADRRQRRRTWALPSC